MPLSLDMCIILALLVVCHFEVLELATLPDENPAGFRHVHLVSRSTIAQNSGCFKIFSLSLLLLCASVCLHVHLFLFMPFTIVVIIKWKTIDCQNLWPKDIGEKMKIEFSQTVMRWVTKISCSLAGGWRIQMIKSSPQKGKRLQRLLCGCVIGRRGINLTWRVSTWSLL